MTDTPPLPPPVPPKPSVPVQATVVQPAIPSVDEGTRIAMLVQLAGQAALMAERTGDERIKRVADCAVKEVQASGALTDILKMMVQAPAIQSSQDRREQERADHSREFYRALNERRQQTNNMLASIESMLPKVVEQLCQTQLTPTATSASSSLA